MSKPTSERSKGAPPCSYNDVVIKQAEPIRLAEAVGTAPGYGSENLGPLFARLLPEVLEHLTRVGAKPGISVGHYE